MQPARFLVACPGYLTRQEQVYHFSLGVSRPTRRDFPSPKL
jgi:hypothetical protein